MRDGQLGFTFINYHGMRISRLYGFCIILLLQLTHHSHHLLLLLRRRRHRHCHIPSAPRCRWLHLLYNYFHVCPQISTEKKGICISRCSSNLNCDWVILLFIWALSAALVSVKVQISVSKMLCPYYWFSCILFPLSFMMWNLYSLASKKCATEPGTSDTSRSMPCSNNKAPTHSCVITQTNRAETFPNFIIRNIWCDVKPVFCFLKNCDIEISAAHE